MNPWTPRFLFWCAGPCPAGPPGYLLPRWLFLRALGLIYFSAFYSLVFQIRGLLGPNGLLPVGAYLKDVANYLGTSCYWYAPTILWFDSSDRTLLALCWIGMVASLLLALNVWPRGTLVICFVLFLSFVSAAQDFSGYQSDGMLLAAGFVSFFFAPPGLRPGLGASQGPSRASLFLLRLLWFTIYFESGVAKYFGGDPSWRDFSAMDEYYQNGPLPTWIGWYAQQLPHWFHVATAATTVGVELFVVWMVFLPRRFRIVCWFIVTFLQIGIIVTANYAFLNYIVLALGVLLLDDRFLLRFLPGNRGAAARECLKLAQPVPVGNEGLTQLDVHMPKPAHEPAGAEAREVEPVPEAAPVSLAVRARQLSSASGLWLAAFFFAWILYNNVFFILSRAFRGTPLPSKPVVLLEPFRVANQYGLFGRMTWKRFEIEFQGSNDGTNWIAYPFCNKPQNPAEAPRIYAPYQPRFDWNLWFASLGVWRENPFVVRTEEALLLGDPQVLSLFASNPFPQGPPAQVRAVLWQYWFTDLATKRSTGMWWRREFLGLYAPALARGCDDKFFVTEWPESLPSPP